MSGFARGDGAVRSTTFWRTVCAICRRRCGLACRDGNKSAYSCGTTDDDTAGPSAEIAPLSLTRLQLRPPWLKKFIVDVVRQCIPRWQQMEVRPTDGG